MGGYAVSHLHLDRAGDRHVAAGVGDHPPLGLSQIAAVDIGDVVAHGVRHWQQLVRAIDMDSDRPTDVAGDCPMVCVNACGHGQRQQLVSRRKLLRAQPTDVLRKLIGCPSAIGLYATHAGLPQALNGGVSVLGTVADM